MTAFALSGSGALEAGSSTSSMASIAPRPRTSPIAGQRDLPGEHPLADPVADDAGPLEEALLLEHVEHGEGRGLRDGVADVRPADRTGVRAVHDLGAPDDAREREARGDRLRNRHQVGLDAEVLHREHPPGAPEAGLHLVGDEHDPVPVAELAEALEVLA